MSVAAVATAVPPAESEPRAFSELEKHLDFRFKNITLLETALTHRSFSNEEREPNIQDNERLEFLGDSVLSLSISDYLFQNYPDFDEGRLSRLRSLTVSRKNLVRVAELMELGCYLRLGRGEKLKSTRVSPSILENALEALIGAIFLDQGYDRVRSVVLRFFHDTLDELAAEPHAVSPKSLLQECIQKKYQTFPVYRVDRTEGPDHRSVFYVSVLVGDKLLGQGTGTSKRDSESDGARDALKRHFNLEAV